MAQERNETVVGSATDERKPSWGGRADLRKHDRARLKSPTIRALVRLADALQVKPSAVVTRMEEHLARTKRR